jgi:hypothetical protein
MQVPLQVQKKIQYVKTLDVSIQVLTISSPFSFFLDLSSPLFFRIILMSSDFCLISCRSMSDSLKVRMLCSIMR